MSSRAADTSIPVDADAPLSGVEYLDAWRAAVRPFPGSVPPFAGFDPVGERDSANGSSTVAGLVADAVDAVAALGSIDAGSLEPTALDDLVAGVEQLRRNDVT